jgi:hypothetical protein
MFVLPGSRGSGGARPVERQPGGLQSAAPPWRKALGKEARLEDLAASLTRGNAPEVKVVLASVVAILAVYQALLMAVGYGKLRLPFLKPVPAARAHRAIGDSILVVTLVVAFLCIAWFGFEDDAALHIVLATALLSTLAFKVAVVRGVFRLGHLLPALGLSVLLLFWATWFSAAAGHLD